MPFGSLKLKRAWQAQFLSCALQIFRKCVYFEDAQMILVPYFAISIGFNFEKNARFFLAKQLFSHVAKSPDFYLAI